MSRGEINRRRAFGAGALPRRYRRRDERPHPDQLDRDDDLDPGEDDDLALYYETATSFDFQMHRVSADVTWWKALTLRERVDGGAADVPEPQRPAIGPDQLVDALFEHVVRLQSPEGARAYLSDPAVPPALAQLSFARQTHASVARWFSERPGSAFMLTLLAPFWSGRLVDWAPPATTNVDTIGRALIEHLLVRHPVPEVLFAPWRSSIRPNLKWVLWLVILGQGASLRRAAARFGWSIRSGFVRELHHAPPELDVVSAVMWAEIRRLGGDERDIRRVLGSGYWLDPTSAAPSLPDEEPDARGHDLFATFWRATVAWLIRHRDQLPEEHAWRLFDWGMRRHTEDLAGGVPVSRRFSWRGRTPRAAVAAARADEIRLATTKFDPSWSARGWDWDQQDPSGAWTVHELTSRSLLTAESRAMRHHLDGFEHRCIRGLAAVFSIRRDGDRQVTVVIEPITRRVLEIRGFANRHWTDEELAIVHRWLAETAQNSK